MELCTAWAILQGNEDRFGNPVVRIDNSTGDLYTTKVYDYEGGDPTKYNLLLSVWDNGNLTDLPRQLLINIGKLRSPGFAGTQAHHNVSWTRLQSYLLETSMRRRSGGHAHG